MSHKILMPLFLSVFVVSTQISCEKSEMQDSSKSQTHDSSISISPDMGTFSTVVTITGKGFNTNPLENKVQFNHVDAVVQSATSSEIVAVVPAGAGYGPVTVVNGSQNFQGPDFNYISIGTVSTAIYDGSTIFMKGLVIDQNGNMYVSDYARNQILRYSPSGAGVVYAGNATSIVIGNSNGPGSDATFHGPTDLAFDKLGNIYIADELNNMIRKISPDGLVSTLAGSGASGFKDGPADVAEFNSPVGLTCDPSGNVIVSDMLNNSIRKITPDGVVSTIAGNGVAGFRDSSAKQAMFNKPSGLACDPSGNIFVADYGNFRIRKITSAGLVTTLAGNGTAGHVDGGNDVAEFVALVGLCLDAQNNLYIIDQGTDDGKVYPTVRKCLPSGFVFTLAGGNSAALNGVGTSAGFRALFGIFCDPFYRVYVTDPFTNSIRQISQE